MEMEIVTTKELARRLHVTPGTIGKWANMGIIPSLRPTPKVLRFEMGSVLKAMAKNAKRRCANGTN
jgi:predicted site-specific integrase-resolvase